MNCIYCHQLTLTYPEYWEEGCSSCNVTYSYVADWIDGVSVSCIEDDMRYKFYLNVAEDYTTFFRDGQYIQSFPGLFWIFPSNVADWVKKMNNLMVFT